MLLAVHYTCNRRQNRSTQPSCCFSISSVPSRSQLSQEILSGAPETIYQIEIRKKYSCHGWNIRHLSLKSFSIYRPVHVLFYQLYSYYNTVWKHTVSAYILLLWQLLWINDSSLMIMHVVPQGFRFHSSLSVYMSLNRRICTVHREHHISFIWKQNLIHNSIKYNIF